MSVPLGKKTTTDAFVAIDFGTRGARIAAARGEAIVRLGDAGELEIPAVLALSAQGGMQAGVEARGAQALFPAETLLGLRGLLAADPEDLRAQGEFFPHTPASGPEGLISLQIGGRARTSVELVGLHLHFLRRTAELGLERPVTSVVLTVPNAFTPFDRQSLRLAARLAGFERVRFIDEPLAAALAWAEQGFRGRAVVCSWGAGQFGASLVEAQPDLLREIASVGSQRIGGDRIDLALARDFLGRADAAAAASGLPALENRAHLARHILGIAQQAKHELAAKGRADLRLHLPGRSDSFRHTYGRADLESWASPGLETARRLVRALLAEAGLGRGDVDALVLAGGMTKLPGVVEALQDAVGRSAADLDERGDGALRGALRRARFLDREVSDPIVLETLPLALGIEGQGGQVTELLSRREIVPASRVELFTTYLEKQSEVGVNLYGHQGLEWEKLARIEVSRIPGMKENEPQIEISLLLDEDGVIEITAQETARSKPLGLEVRPVRGLTATQWTAAHQEGPAPDERAFEERLREELRERGRLQLETARALARQTPAVLTRDEKQLVGAKVQELEEVLEGGDLVEMRSCQRELGEALQPILQRVYDKSLEALLR